MVGSLMNAFASQYKKNKAQKDEYDAHDRLLALDKERPQYTGSELAKQSVNPLYDANIAMYQQGAKSNLLPGQAYMQSRIDNNAANAISGASRTGLSGSQLTSLMAGALAGSRDSNTDMAISGAEYRKGQQQQLAGANIDKAEEQDKAWNQNVWEPYAELKDREYMQWLDAANRKEQWAAQQQQAGAQAGQDAGNFFKSYFTKGMGGGGGGDTTQSVNFTPSMSKYGSEGARARYQGTNQSWQKAGRGF